MQRTLFPDQPGTTAVQAGSAINLEQLNESQYEAVTTLTGPVLVIAGAGSGKTRTLVYRMAHLVEKGVPPEEILLLTFTRKAAQEMQNRASALMDDSCQRVVGGTFHAVANLLLRRYGQHLGYAASFTILDQSDAEGIVNLLKTSLELGKDSKRFPSKRLIVNILSKAVNKSLALGELLDEEYAHLSEFYDDLKLIREHYRKFKLEHMLMDYDDLLVNWKRVLAEYPEVQETLVRRFSHIMVDEYQDTNPIQAEIVRLMAGSRRNVMVVGDDSQSIYSFRGADFRNIMDFPKLFPGCRLIRLEQNYRSTQEILSVTNAIIEKAEEKYSKTLFSRIEGGEKPVIHGAMNEAAQARYVVDTIDALRKEGMALQDIAVLFRSGFHSYKLELELGSRHIEFEKRGGLKLTESAHIKDVLSYLRLVTNPHDLLSWNRILLQLDKVGPKTAQKVLARIKNTEDPLAALQQYPAGKSWQALLNDLTAMLGSLHGPRLSPTERFDLVLDYYTPVFERIYHDDYPRRRMDLEQLRSIIAGYDDLQDFLDDTSLDPPEPGDAADSPPPGGSGRLVLSTVHSAKGLEWDAVFIIHLVEGKFPSAQAVLPEHREEERRLLYVAATRAKKRLFLVYPREVSSYDRKLTTGTISPFLQDIPAALVSSAFSPGRQPYAQERPQSAWSQERKASSSSKGKTTSITASALKPGLGVRHPFFGEGRIETVVGPRTVDVFFKRHGKKTLHLDYAKLEILP